MSFISQSRRVAFGGVISSLALLMMFMSGLIPTATFALPAMAGVAIMTLMIEFDLKTAFISYLAVSFLSLILVVDKEAVLVFIFLFGHYPMIKSIIEDKTNIIIGYILKTALFNLCIIFAYYLALNLFGMGNLVDEFEEIAFWGSLILLITSNFTFFLYDYTLTALIPYYIIKIKPRLK